MWEPRRIESISRASVQSSYCGDHTALCRVLSRYLMYVDTRDVSFAPHMMLNGFWESWVTAAIGNHLRPGMKCADIGAAFGYYTLFMADQVGPTGVVHAYEPNKRAAELLERSLVANGFQDRVRLHNVAVGANDSTAVLSASEQLPINGSIIPGVELNHPCAGRIRQNSIPIVRLDTHLPLPLDFVKIDAEGSELSILDGAPADWRHDPKLTLCIEHAPKAYPMSSVVVERLQEWGRTLGYVTARGDVAPFERFDADWCMLWVPPSGGA